MPPAAAHGLLRQRLYAFGTMALVAIGLTGKSRLITRNNMLQDSGRRHSWLAERTPRGRGQRKAQPDQIMRRVPDDRLIKIPHLNRDAALRIRQGPEIADIAIAANPYRWTFGNFTSRGFSHS